MMKIYTLSGKV